MPNGDSTGSAKEELRELTMHRDEREHPGEPSPYSCPECGGVLWELRDGELFRFRCRVGHGYTSDTLTSEQALTVEHALWTALRALEEQAAVRRRMAGRASRQGMTASADRYQQRALELEVPFDRNVGVAPTRQPGGSMAVAQLGDPAVARRLQRPIRAFLRRDLAGGRTLDRDDPPEVPAVILGCDGE